MFQRRRQRRSKPNEDGWNEKNHSDECPSHHPSSDTPPNRTRRPSFSSRLFMMMMLFLMVLLCMGRLQLFPRSQDGILTLPRIEWHDNLLDDSNVTLLIQPPKRLYWVSQPRPLATNHTWVDSYPTMKRKPVVDGVVKIPPYDHILYNKQRQRFLKRIDDEDGRYDMEEDVTAVCRKPTWAKVVHPNCHAFHEINLGHDNNTQWISHGTYRDAWRYYPEEAWLLKTMIFTDPELQYDAKRFSQIQTDAAIMEALTASNRITDLYGYCGTSVLTEPLQDTVLSNLLGTAQGNITDDSSSVCQNQLTLHQKLDWAIQFTESLAELHGYVGGVMMHGDFHSPQWLLATTTTTTNDLKLNDFNKGHIFLWNGTDYCPTRRCYDGTFRAPEELRCERAGNEASDTHALGHNLYMLLTGRWPHYEFSGASREELYDAIVHHGRIPYVHPSFHNRSIVEDTLIDLMHACWERDIHARISVFEVLKRLYRVRSSEFNRNHAQETDGN